MTLATLLSPATLGKRTLKNHVVMAPMTRSRAIGNVPNALMAEYYAQRAGVGLIVTEGTSPSPDGLGYARIPGCYSEAQRDGWKLVADAVHARGAIIFVQLMHTGRVAHQNNLPAGARVVSASAVQAPGTMFTDQAGPQDHPVPHALTLEELPRVVAEFAHAARIAVAAGMDGVELHGANGYLLEQFLNPSSNRRTDAYGGSADNRHRFVIEVAKACVDAIGGDRVGIRLSPYGVNGGMTSSYDGIDDSYVSLAKKLGEAGVQYIHLVDHSALGAPPPPASLKAAMRAAFPRTFILAGGFTAEAAEQALVEKRGDLIAFGRPVLANPDFVARVARGAPLNPPDMKTLYTPGATGYTDYPTAT